MHAHAWDFADQPLVYQGFFGNQRGQDGVQLKWIAPTNLLVELGAETGNGDAFPGTREGGNGLNGTTLFAHIGGDIGDNASWRAGGAWIDLDAEGREYEDSNAAGLPVLNAFTGRSETWVADAVLKWAPGGDPRCATSSCRASTCTAGKRATSHSTSKMPRCPMRTAARSLAGTCRGFTSSDRVGARAFATTRSIPATPRLGWLLGTRSAADFPALLPSDPTRTTLMLDWNPSEFSRLRVQYAWDDARDGGDTDQQLQLQYLYGIGAHGAHKY